MGRSKRASMREGPLADLFRSTEESVGEDEVRVTATREEVTTTVEVATHEPQPEIEVTKVEDADVEDAEAREITEAPEPKAEAKVEEVPKTPAERNAKEHLTDEIMLKPAKDPAVEEIEEKERAYRELHDLPEHPLVADGFRSIGCMPCTDRVAEGEDERSGRWRGRGKTECGIHLGLAAFETEGSGI